MARLITIALTLIVYYKIIFSLELNLGNSNTFLTYLLCILTPMIISLIIFGIFEQREINKKYSVNPLPPPIQIPDYKPKQYTVDLTPTYKIDPQYNPSVYLKNNNKPTSTLPSASSVDLIINYPSHGTHQKRRITAYGLGRFRNNYYIIAFCHLRQERRTFKLAVFRKAINAETGEVITSVKSYLLQMNPYVTDLTDEFMSLHNENQI